MKVRLVKIFSYIQLFAFGALTPKSTFHTCQLPTKIKSYYAIILAYRWPTITNYNSYYYTQYAHDEKILI